MNVAARNVTSGFTVLLLICAAAAGYFHQWLWLAAPIVVAVAWYLLQYPHLILYALAATIPWSVEYNLTSALGTDLPDEQLMWLGAGASLLLLAYRWRSFAFQKMHPLLWMLLLQLAWTFSTVLLSTHPLLSLKYLIAKSWYLLAFVVLPLFVWKDVAVLKRAVVILVSSMMLFVCWALYRHQQYGFSFENVNDALAPFYRNHVNYSALLVFMIPLLLLFFQRVGSLPMKFIMLLFTVIAMAAVYLSYARGAWLALLVAGVSYFLIKKQWLVKAFVLSLAAVLIGIGVLAYNNTYLRFAPRFHTTVFHTDFNEHLKATYQFEDMSTIERYYRWIAGVRMAGDSWQMGFGPNTFYEHYKGYTIPAFKTWVSKNEERSTVHNYFLFLLIEQGVAGLVLFLVLVGSMFWYLQKLYRVSPDAKTRQNVQAITAILTMICVVNFLSDMIETDKVGSIFYSCIAVIIILCKKQKNSNQLPAEDAH